MLGRLDATFPGCGRRELVEWGSEVFVADGPSDQPSTDYRFGYHPYELQPVHPGSAGAIRVSVGKGPVPRSLPQM